MAKVIYELAFFGVVLLQKKSFKFIKSEMISITEKLSCESILPKLFLNPLMLFLLNS